jgi:hypothetical protein
MREISQYRKSDNQCRVKSLGRKPSELPRRTVRSGLGPSGQRVRTVRATGPDRPGNGSGLSDDARNILLINLANNTADATDWRAHISNYLRNPNIRTNINVRRTTFKYVLDDDELYR